MARVPVVRPLTLFHCRKVIRSLGYSQQIGRAADWICRKWPPHHYLVVADVGLSEEDCADLEVIAKQEGLDAVELEKAVTAASLYTAGLKGPL